MLSLFSVSSSYSATVNFIQNSLNDTDSSVIGAVSSEVWLETAVEYSTVTAPAVSGSYRFTHWSNDSYPAEPYRDAWGRSLNPISFVLFENTIASAHYLPAVRNTDSDGVPDWFEMEYYGALTNGAASDSDGDSIPLIGEYTGGTHPLFGNATQAGGVEWADSPIVSINLAGFATYSLHSEPAGAVNQSETVPPGTVVTSPDLSGNASFGFWEMDGVRQQDAWGVAYPQITFEMQGTNRGGVAYLFAGDSDGDGIADAYEQYYFGTLAYNGSSDSDGDGATLSNEYAVGSSPLCGNTNQSGGVFWDDSDLVTVNLAGFSRYILRSEPASVVSQSALVSPGTEVTTPNMSQSTFGYWLLDGVRQEDAWGVAKRQINFTVDESDREAVAYLFADDSDSDGVNDGLEYYYYGNLDQTGDSDTDGDGITLLNDDQPLYGNQHQEGGVFWNDSGLMVVNLQPFERVDFTLVDGILTNFFSIRSSQMTGIDLGANTAPGLGDWDGDGDLDLYVASAASPLRVYENVGSIYRWDMSDRSSAFGSLGISGGTPALGDWNGDGFADLTVGFSDGTVRILSSSGSFDSLACAVDYIIDTQASNVVPTFGEVTGDNLLDLLVLLNDGTIRVYPNQNSAAVPFDESVSINNWAGISVPNGTGLAMEDLTFDENSDVLVSDVDGRIWEFHAEGTGSCNLDSKVWGGTYDGFADRLTLAAGDLDGDGDTDAILGFAEGGLIYLRDPRGGIPSYLKAYGGAGSVRLIWDPSRDYHLKGYYIYRATEPFGVFGKLTTVPVPVSGYMDANVAAGLTCYYYVTAVNEVYYPGNSLPREIESPPSETVSATVDTIRLWMPDYFGKAGETAVLQLNVEHGTGILGAGLDLRVTYDSALLTPLSQVSTSTTVRKTALTEDLTVTDNAATANGELRISGVSGTVVGDGHLFDLYFQIAPGAAAGSVATHTFSLAALQGQGSIPLTVDSSDTALFTVTASGYFLGDVNGDGVLDMDDHHHLMWLLKKKTRDPIPEEISAGDMNGNGELDNKDISLHLRLIHGHES